MNILHFLSVPFLLVAFASTGYCWLPYAHVSMVRDEGNPELEEYTMSPDLWATWEYDGIGGGSGLTVITPKFCWGHVVRRSGGFFSPNRPDISTEGLFEDPALDIGYLAIMHKVESFGDEEFKTGMGWYLHNAADLAVHYNLFPGGYVWAWSQHLPRESYAEAILYIADKIDGTSVDFGPASLPPPNPSPKVISLAQKCFRKNRQTISSVEDDDENTFQVENSIEIQMDLREFIATGDYKNCIDEIAELNSMGVPEEILANWENDTIGNPQFITNVLDARSIARINIMIAKDYYHARVASLGGR